MNQKHSISRLAMVCTLSLICAANNMQAAGVVGSMQEPFDYPDTTQFINNSTLNGGLGWNPFGNLEANGATNTWGTVLTAGNALYRTATAPGLSYAATGYLPASGNKLTLDAVTA